MEEFSIKSFQKSKYENNFQIVHLDEDFYVRIFRRPSLGFDVALLLHYEYVIHERTTQKNDEQINLAIKFYRFNRNILCEKYFDRHYSDKLFEMQLELKKLKEFFDFMKKINDLKGEKQNGATR